MTTNHAAIRINRDGDNASRGQDGPVEAHPARTLPPAWPFEEISERCLLLGEMPRMSEAEIMARRTRDLMPAECQNEEAVMAWIAELFRGGSVTGRPVDDWQYLEAVARKRVGDEIFDSQWARLTGNFFMILHPDIRPGNLGMKELRSVVERLVAAVELDRAIRC